MFTQVLCAINKIPSDYGSKRLSQGKRDIFGEKQTDRTESERRSLCCKSPIKLCVSLNFTFPFLSLSLIHTHTPTNTHIKNALAHIHTHNTRSLCVCVCVCVQKHINLKLHRHSVCLLVSVIVLLQEPNLFMNMA